MTRRSVLQNLLLSERLLGQVLGLPTPSQNQLGFFVAELLEQKLTASWVLSGTLLHVTAHPRLFNEPTGKVGCLLVDCVVCCFIINNKTIS